MKRDQIALFNVSDFQHSTKVKTPRMTPRMCRAEMTLLEAFPALEHGYDYPYATGSDWGMHELITHIISLVGPCEMTAATWAVATKSSLEIVEFLESGKLTNVTFLVDHRVCVHTPDFMQVAKNGLARVCVSGVHAKAFVLENADWKISVVGSANFTENPRIEAGHLSTCPEIAAFHKGWILAEMDRGQPFGRDMVKASKTKW